MRTLNRPMFRYGGPIKEGVMNGIREPKRNGGSMGAALVGNPVYPKTNGREHHAFVLGAALPAIGAAALRFGRPLLQGAKRIFGKTTTQPAPYTPVRLKTTGGYSEYGPASYTRKFVQDTAAKGTPKGLGGTEIFTPNFLGRDPLITAGGKIISAVTNPAVTGKLAGAARLVFSPSGAVLGGLYYANGKFFNKKGEEVPPPKGDIKIGGKVGTSGAPGGGNPDMTYTAPEKELTAAEIEAAEAKARREKMDSYKEIMDIKGMSKDAAYKSLIDASKIIQEGGNLKKQLRDGSLIANITQAASKRFDKVGDTEAALRSLVAKGEIDKEMNKDKNALDNAVKNAQLKAYNKQNEGLSTSEMIQKRLQTAKGEFPQGDELRKIISLNNPELNAKTLPSGDIPTNVDALDYIIGQVAAVNADPKTGDYPDGVYVIKDRIIQVFEGEVIPISVNQLK